MNVLVTGSSGFIGAHLVEHLRAAGLNVRAAGRQPPATGGVEFYALPDVRKADWPTLLTGVDAVVHLAAMAHARAADEAAIRQTNCEPVVALCRALGARQRLIFVSSIRAVVGPGAQRPIEDATPPNPVCAYGRGKLAAEQAVQEFVPRAAILRPTTVYGFGAKHNMARLAAAARSPLPLPVAGFDAPRSYASVQNVCSAVSFMLRGELSGPFNVADPDVACLRDLVVWLREAVASPKRTFAMPRILDRLWRGAGRWSDLRRLVCEPLVARPEKLLAAGWRPEHASTRDGVHRWSLDAGGLVRA